MARHIFGLLLGVLVVLGTSGWSPGNSPALQRGGGDAGGALACLVGLGVIALMSWLVISGSMQGRNERKQLSMVTNLPPTEAISAISRKLASLGYTKSHEDATSAVFGREIPASCGFAGFWFVFGIIPGLLYLVYGKYQTLLTADAVDEGGGTRLSLDAQGRVAANDAAALAQELPQLPQPTSSSAPEPGPSKQVCNRVRCPERRLRGVLHAVRSELGIEQWAGGKEQTGESIDPAHMCAGPCTAVVDHDFTHRMGRTRPTPLAAEPDLQPGHPEIPGHRILHRPRRPGPRNRGRPAQPPASGWSTSLPKGLGAMDS